jgi:hypothetical protein
MQAIFLKDLFQEHEIRLEKERKFSLILLVLDSYAEVDTGRKILH